jgi:hypothetical protein
MTTVARSGRVLFTTPTLGFWVLVRDQLDAKFFYITRVFQSSTCFEQTRDHHQEVNYINL